MSRRRKFWGWGWEDEVISEAQRKSLGQMFKARFGSFETHEIPEPTIDDIELRDPRIAPPSSLTSILSSDKYDRAAHTYGKSTRDILRGAHRQFEAPPDLIAYPETEQQLIDVLDWCTRERVAVVPFGGGTSVCGGVESGLIEGDYRGAVSLDLARLDRILEIDRKSRAARIQAGIFGPALEDGLRPEGLTLRHFPQSFEFSTLGGWIATRSGGHYATLYTHIDEFVESLRVVTPSGALETRRLPGSGAGPSPDRLFIGSEGSLGVITEAWMRLQDRPKFRATASIKFSGADGFLRGAEAVRLISQSGLYPTNCRLIDAAEAEAGGAGDGKAALLVLGFESADHPLEAWGARALEICRSAGGEFGDEALKTRTDEEGARSGAAGAWRDSFLRAPYMRDVLILMGAVAETFETAVTWDTFETFYGAVKESGESAIRKVCGEGSLTCRFTHAYPDGPAPYFTVMAPGRAGSELAQWNEIKGAVSDAIIEHGGTITHHHAVGRDHRPWYDRQRPDLFARALKGAKRELDPAGILNPGVLIEP
jgi:alkyldihydroxyacetonephosphate synthase